MLSKESLELIARTCHEANRTICEFYGDDTQKIWNDAEDWQKESSLEGVKVVIENPSITAEQIHDEWVNNKTHDGWTHGTVKDATAKTHPMMVPYDQLPDHEKLKDEMFVSIVKSFLS